MVGMKNKDKLRVLVFYSASADWWKKIDKNGRVNNLGALGSLFSLGIDLAGLHTHIVPCEKKWRQTFIYPSVSFFFAFFLAENTHREWRSTEHTHTQSDKVLILLKRLFKLINNLKERLWYAGVNGDYNREFNSRWQWNDAKSCRKSATKTDRPGQTGKPKSQAKAERTSAAKWWGKKTTTKKRVEHVCVFKQQTVLLCVYSHELVIVCARLGRVFFRPILCVFLSLWQHIIALKRFLSFFARV